MIKIQDISNLLNSLRESSLYYKLNSLMNEFGTRDNLERDKQNVKSTYWGASSLYLKKELGEKAYLDLLPNSSQNPQKMQEATDNFIKIRDSIKDESVVKFKKMYEEAEEVLDRTNKIIEKHVNDILNEVDANKNSSLILSLFLEDNKDMPKYTINAEWTIKQIEYHIGNNKEIKTKLDTQSDRTNIEGLISLIDRINDLTNNENINKGMIETAEDAAYDLEPDSFSSIMEGAMLIETELTKQLSYLVKDNNEEELSLEARFLIKIKEDHYNDGITLFDIIKNDMNDEEFNIKENGFNNYYLVDSIKHLKSIFVGNLDIELNDKQKEIITSANDTFFGQLDQLTKHDLVNHSKLYYQTVELFVNSFNNIVNCILPNSIIEEVYYDRSRMPNTVITNINNSSKISQLLNTICRIVSTSEDYKQFITYDMIDVFDETGYYFYFTKEHYSQIESLIKSNIPIKYDDIKSIMYISEEYYHKYSNRIVVKHNLEQLLDFLKELLVFKDRLISIAANINRKYISTDDLYKQFYEVVLYSYNVMKKLNQDYRNIRESFKNDYTYDKTASNSFSDMLKYSMYYNILCNKL